MAPNLPVYPVSDVGKAPTRVAYRKVFHPTAQNRIDLFDHAAYRLGTRGTENLFQFAKQCRSLLALRQYQRHPSSPATPDTTELKTEKSEALASLQVHGPALLLIHLHLQFGQF